MVALPQSLIPPPSNREPRRNVRKEHTELKEGSGCCPEAAELKKEGSGCCPEAAELKKEGSGYCPEAVEGPDAELEEEELQCLPAERKGSTDCPPEAAEAEEGSGREASPEKECHVFVIDDAEGACDPVDSLEGDIIVGSDLPTTANALEKTKTRRELIAMCEERDLPTGGKKNDLAKRLTDE